MPSSDPAEASRELAMMAQDIERKAQQFQQLHDRMAALAITETSADRKVSVTVDGNGVPTDIRLAANARGADPAHLSDQIMACLRRAQATLRARVTDLVHGSVGDDEAGQILINQFADRFPDPEPEEPPVPPMERPTPTWTPPAPPEPAPGSAAPGRNDVFIPEEPTDEDLYYQRRSWLE